MQATTDPWQAAGFLSIRTETLLRVYHWRHTAHFRELGKKGATGHLAKVPPSRRSTFARRPARAR